MEGFTTYLLLAGLYISIFYLGFVFISKLNYDFRLQRFLIVGSVLLSLVLPMMSLGFLADQSSISAILSVVTITPNQQIIAVSFADIVQSDHVNFWTIVNVFFTLGFVTSLFRFLFGLSKIYTLVKEGERVVYDTDKTLFLSNIETPCSFLNYIFLPRTMELDLKETKVIVHHEIQHIKLKHSIDNVLLAFIQCVFWWLPTYYLLQRQLKLIHEYEADANVIVSENKYAYSNFLIEQLPNQKLLLLNHFNSFIKKRISMMYQSKKQSNSLYAVAIYLFILVFAFGIQACQSDIGHETKSLSSLSSGENVSQGEKIYKTLKAPNKMPMEASCISDVEPYEEQLKCSDQKLLMHVYKNIVYPAAARDNGIEGQVVCQFVITKEGKVRSPKIVKELGYGTSETVLETLRDMEEKGFTWSPGMVGGKPVDVVYSLPVKFKLQ